MDKLLIVIRGIPGSGKSTLGQAIMSLMGGAQFEADQFFTGTDGVYRYISKYVPAAHEWCRRGVEQAMKEGISPLIVSNTGTNGPHVQMYLDLAKQHGYRAQQIVCFAELGSVHNVPEESMQRMKTQLRIALINSLERGELL